MRILILNPNTSAAVTDLLLAAATPVAGPGTELVPLTAPRGFPYLSTRAEAQVAGAIALETLAAHAAGADAAVIAAFADPGLAGARELFDFPVVGMAEAAMLTACMLGRRFAIVTFAPDLAGWFRDGVEGHGLAGRCAGIRAVADPVTSLDDVQDERADALVELANRAVAADGADVVILAGAPLAGLAGRVAGRIAVPVVDPIAAAVKQAEALVALGPRKAAAGSSRRPAAKPASGLAPQLAALWRREQPGRKL